MNKNQNAIVPVEVQTKAKEEDSVFSNNPDWYLRMEEDQNGGWADYS